MMADYISHSEMFSWSKVSRLPSSDQHSDLPKIPVDDKANEKFSSTNTDGVYIPEIQEDDDKEGNAPDRDSAVVSDATDANCPCKIDYVEKYWKEDLHRTIAGAGVFGSGKCEDLLEVLKKYPCLLDVSSEKGDTVLHAAALEGSLELLLYICDLFLIKGIYPWTDGRNGRREPKTYYENCCKKINKAAFFEKANDDTVTAKDLLWFTMGSTRLYQHYKHVLNDDPFFPIEYKSFQALQDELMFGYQGTDRSRHDAIRCMKDIVNKSPNFHKMLERYLTVGMREELIHRHTILHSVVCFKNLPFSIIDYQKELDFLKTVMCGFAKEGPKVVKAVVKALIHSRDNYGWTPMHYAVMMMSDVLDFEKFYGLFDELNNGANNFNCFNGRDGKGWTALHCAAA